MVVRTLVVAACALFCAAGCGSGDGEDGQKPAGGEVVRVEIVQTGLLLTQAGERRRLTAVAYDAEGAPVAPRKVGWTSTTPAEIAVDDRGEVTANTQNGSTQLVVEADGVKSPPLLGIVTEPPPGALLLTDADIVGEPREAAPEAAPALANTHEVVLSGVSPPAVGTLVLSTESKPAGGKVVAVAEADGKVTLTLGMVSVRELLPKLTIHQLIDLAAAPLIIPPEVEATYDIQRTGSTLRFDPKPVEFETTFPLGVFECEADVPLPVQVGTSPAFTVSQSFGLDLRFSGDHGLERFVVQGELGPRIEVGVDVTAGFEGSVECAKELFAIRIPIGGVLSFFVAGLVPVEVGFAIGGKVSVASASLGIQAEATATAEIGVECPVGGSCEFVRSLTGNAKLEPQWNVPTFTGVRFEPSVEGFGRVELAIGNPFWRSLRLDTFYAKMGPELKGSFANRADQIADAQYESSYGLTLESRAGVGKKLDEALELLGIETLSALELVGSVDLAKSPKGKVTAAPSVFAVGDPVTVQVKLDPASVDFFPGIGPYNVKQLVLVKSQQGAPPITEIKRVDVSAGTTTLDIPFTADAAGNATDLTVFAVTQILPLDVFSLEVGSPARERIAFVSHAGGDPELVLMNPDGSGQVSITTNAVLDQDPSWSPDGSKLVFGSGVSPGIGVFVVNADGSGLTKLAGSSGHDDSDPAWSPDGGRIAFTSNRDGNNEIYVMNADGSGQTRLTSDPGSDMHPTWSPDGAKIAFSSLRQKVRGIWVMNANGSAQVEVTAADAGGTHPAWSPDGSKIAFARSVGKGMDIFVMNPSGGGVTQLTANGDAWTWYPTWSPDGSKLAVAGNLDDANNYEIYSMNADGTGVSRLTNQAFGDTMPAWSPK